MKTIKDTIEMENLYKILTVSPSVFVKSINLKPSSFLDDLNVFFSYNPLDNNYKKELKEFGRTLINITLAKRSPR